MPGQNRIQCTREAKVRVAAFELYEILLCEMNQHLCECEAKVSAPVLEMACLMSVYNGCWIP